MQLFQIGQPRIDIPPELQILSKGYGAGGRVSFFAKFSTTIDRMGRRYMINLFFSLVDIYEKFHKISYPSPRPVFEITNSGVWTHLTPPPLHHILYILLNHSVWVLILKNSLSTFKKKRSFNRQKRWKRLFHFYLQKSRSLLVFYKKSQRC